MLYANVNQNIPRKYHAINSINAIDVRTSIGASVITIIDASRNLREHTPDPETQSTVDRFMTYLEKSCESTRLINRRAAWLSVYGNIAAGLISRFYNRTVLTPDQTMIASDHDDLMEHLEKLMVAIAMLSGEGKFTNTGYESSILATCESIVSFFERNTSSQKKHYYDMAHREISHLMKFLDETKSSFSAEDAAILQTNLVSLYKKISLYRNRSN